ncbi:MAG: hypothetical protein HQL73_11415, partial [Magnetococcales bacterium]|nr:hypothetical protein [Magnetococcales bacterium]
MKHSQDAILLMRLWVMVRPFLGQLLISLGCMIFMAASSGAIAYMVQPLVDEVFIRKDAHLV